MEERIGFISTRFEGNDGVSLESAKWAQVLRHYKHTSYWYAGRLDRDPQVSHCVPEAFFGHPEVEWINEHLWGRNSRSRLVSRRIHEMVEYLKETLYEFQQRFDPSILVLQNVVTIPMHLPLGLAITEFLSETRIPAIAHHHDFFWERMRFTINAANEYLDMAFPPRIPTIQHVVINQAAQEELCRRKGLPSVLIPNVIDFENSPPPEDYPSAEIRAAIGLGPGDVMILQPTRVVPRKGIEHAIRLVELLGDPKYKLVISHEAGDEGLEYVGILRDLARECGVDMRFVGTRPDVGPLPGLDSGHRTFALWDLYREADFVTYPSLYEGFGNAFLETIYFRKPLMINRYSTFVRDIEPQGFWLVVMDGVITRQVVAKVRHLLEDRDYRDKVVDHNYEVAKRYYSYSVLRRKLRVLITNVTGLETP